MRLPKDDVEWLEDHYPDPGAKQWFFSEALRSFREHHEVTPDDLISESMRSLRLTE